MCLPKVSIVIPTLNSEKMISKTLDSLSLLDYENVEIVIIDGRSTDGTLEIVKNKAVGDDVRMIIEPKRGRGIAYNRGIKESNGKYVAFLDSDAKIGSSLWIKNAVKVMEDNEKVAVVFTKVYSPTDSSFMQKSIDTFLCKGFTTANGAVYRKSAVVEAGGFNTSMNYMQEDELLNKLEKLGYLYKVNTSDEILHYHRNSIIGYIKQNVQAAKGALAYFRATKRKWILKDALLRVASFSGLMALLALLMYFRDFKILILSLITLYLGTTYLVNSKTCERYKFSKYVLTSPVFIFLSLVGYVFGLLQVILT
ncbi:hypothetical protein HS7_15300 [Sulfolobales archaeon HS-7]|nr:hypothetical protein HS7_15300 [Sulfolobales archaeon HS-7]